MAWKQLRHPGAHGTVMQFSDLDNEQFGVFSLNIRKASMLMHHICFYLIGYQGPHTDYGLAGWPNGALPTSSAGIPAVTSVETLEVVGPLRQSG